MRVTLQAGDGAQVFDSLPSEKILRAALRQGAALPYDCATGTCGTCKARLVSGRVADAWPAAPGRRSCGPGEVLTCQSAAIEDCTITVERLRPAEAGTPRPASRAGWLRRRRPLTHDVTAFDVELDAPLDFTAGQFVLIETPAVEGARAFSIGGAADGGRRLALVAKRRPGGRFGGWLREEATDGAPMAVFGPLGRAVFDRAAGKHLLCIAGGTGLAGMLAILGRAADDGHLTRFDAHLFFGVRAADDVFWLDELAALRARHPTRLTVTVALSEDEAPPSLIDAYPQLRFARGLVHEIAGAHLERGFADLGAAGSRADFRADFRAYVAGPRPMVDASVRLLVQRGRLPPQEIRRDRFD